MNSTFSFWATHIDGSGETSVTLVRFQRTKVLGRNGCYANITKLWNNGKEEESRPGFQSSNRSEEWPKYFPEKKSFFHPSFVKDVSGDLRKKGGTSLKENLILLVDSRLEIKRIANLDFSDGSNRPDQGRCQSENVRSIRGIFKV